MLSLGLRRAGALFFILLGTLAVSVVGLRAEDWPQWRGVDRLGVWHETGIVERFPDEGLKVNWRMPIGSGYAGPAVAGGRVFVLDWVEDTKSRTMDGTERLLAFDENTGALLWTYEWQTSYRMLMVSYAIGPRATPTVDGDRVYVVGATGRLFCLDVETGEPRWDVDYVADYDTSVPPWGITGAPLIEGDRLIAIVGGEPDALVVAFDKRTGLERWRSLDVVAEAGYGQPVIFEAGGARQLIVWHPMGLASLDPGTGNIYWSQNFETAEAMTVATPVRSGRYLLVSQMYNGSLMMRFATDRPEATLFWKGTSNSIEPGKTEGLQAMNTTPILLGDYVYGVGLHGELRGLDARTGERLWMSDRMTAQTSYATAFFVQQAGRFFVNNDDGELIMAQFTPEGYVELDRVQLIEPTSPDGRFGTGRLVNWVHPAYANGHVFQRNDKEILRASLSVKDY